MGRDPSSRACGCDGSGDVFVSRVRRSPFQQGVRVCELGVWGLGAAAEARTVRKWFAKITQAACFPKKNGWAFRLGLVSSVRARSPGLVAMRSSLQKPSGSRLRVSTRSRS